MNYRTNNFPSYYENNPRLGHSNVSRGFGQSYRNPADDHNMAEVEFMLENERKKFKDTKDKLEHDLDNERKLRIEFQNKLIKLKDQFSRKDVSLSEYEFKINNLLHQNQDISVENDRLKHELARLEELYGGKIHQLETQLAMEAKNFQETTLQYNGQFEKFKKEGQQYVQQLTFDFERKVKNLEQKCKGLQLNRKDLQMQNKKLNDVLINNKLNFEEQIRDIKNRARDQEIKKSQHLTRACEQKIKMVEDSKDVLARKNHELLRALQDKQRQIGELEADKTQQCNKLRQDCGDMHQQNNHLTFLLSKYKQEIAEKEAMVGRAMNDNDTEIMTLKQQLQSKKSQNSQLAASMRDMRSNFKQNENDWERRKRELLERNSALEMDARKYKDEYVKICEVLKSKINTTIDHISYKK